MDHVEELKQQMRNLPDDAVVLTVWLDPSEMIFRSFSTLGSEAEIARFLARFIFVANLTEVVGNSLLQYHAETPEQDNRIEEFDSVN